MSLDLETRLTELAPEPQRKIDVEQLKNEGARRRKRGRISGSVAIAAALAIGAIVTIPLLRDEERAIVPPVQEKPQPPEPFKGWDLKAGWTQLPAPPEPLAKGASIWTGAELILYGGEASNGGSVRAVGYAYDPRSSSWRSLPRTPLAARPGVQAVWTETQMIVWGGYDVPPGDPQGAIYTPSTDAWTDLSDSPIDVRSPVAYVWTGREFVVWGTTDRNNGSVEGAAYDPVAETWRQISDAPMALNQGQGIWTGSEMIVLGSHLNNTNNSETTTAQGMAYNPETDEWRVLADSELSPQASSIVWTEEKAIAWDYGIEARFYDPASDEWQKMPDMPLRSSECYPSSAVTGEAMLAHFCSQMALYDFSMNSWQHAEPPVEVPFELVAADDVFLVAGSNHESTVNALWAFKPFREGLTTYPPPRFYNPPWWFADGTGATVEGDGRQPSAWVSTVDLGDGERWFYGLERLGSSDIAIVAGLITPEDYPNYPIENFPHRERPLDLSDADIRSEWEGQPDPRIPEYLLLAEVEGHLVEVRVFFGRQDPGPELLQKAQEQLEYLAFP